MTDPQTPPDALSRPLASTSAPEPPTSRFSGREAMREPEERVRSVIAEARAKNKKLE